MEDFDADNRTFDLDSFFPYQVRAYHVAVSQSLSSVYTELLGISVNEWRTMAILGSEHHLSASEIVQRASVDKVAVSRAIKGLLKAGYLRRDIDGRDKRRAVLSLTRQGRQAFEKVIPLVRQRENALLQGFSPPEKQTLLKLMQRVQSNAENLKTKPSRAPKP